MVQMTVSRGVGRPAIGRKPVQSGISGGISTAVIRSNDKMVW
jgi:hypothetical protein